MARKALFAATLAASLFLSALLAALDTGAYKLVKIQLVGGDGGFDYVTADPDGRNLYVARSGPAGHIGVFNLDTLAEVGDIPGTSAHGAAVDTATRHGFATSSPVTMFDAKTFAVLKKIHVQGHPDGYLNDPYNYHFYIEQTVPTPARAKTLTLDTKTGHVFSITTEYGPVPAAPAQPMNATPPSNVPAWMRGPRPPMIPGSFQILVIGK